MWNIERWNGWSLGAGSSVGSIFMSSPMFFGRVGGSNPPQSTIVSSRIIREFMIFSVSRETHGLWQKFIYWIVLNVSRETLGSELCRFRDYFEL